MFKHIVKSDNMNSFYLLTLSPKGSISEKARRFLKEQLRKIIKNEANHDTDDDVSILILHETYYYKIPSSRDRG